MRNKCFVFFLIISKIIISQNDSSKAVIYFKPKDAIIYLDGKKISSNTGLVKIAIGIHYIKAWAPKYDLFTDSFIVKKKENKFYSKKLVYTDNYKTYRAKKRLKVLTYTVPMALSIGFASTYYKRYQNFDKRINQAHTDAIELKGLYENSFSPQEFDTYYTQYYQKTNDYKDLQAKQIKDKKQGIIISSTLAATAITVFIVQLALKKTHYQEIPLLSRITPGFNPINKQICLTVNLY